MLLIVRLCKSVTAVFQCLCDLLSENEILREGNVSLEILRDKMKTRVSDLEDEMRRLRDELERSLSNRETKNADDEVIKTSSVLNSVTCILFGCNSVCSSCICESWDCRMTLLKIGIWPNYGWNFRNQLV